MLQKIIYFHMKELGNYNLVFKKMKTYWFGYIFLLVLGGVAILLIPGFYKFYSFIFFIILTPIGIFFINKMAKNIIHKNYGLDQDELRWGGASLISYKEERLKEYLETSLKINLSKNIPKIIDALNKEIESSKLSVFFVPGIFVGLFLPLWNQYAISQFKNINLRIDAIEVLSVHLIAILVITYLVSVLKFILIDVISFRRTRLKELIGLVEGISLRLDEGNSEK